jgi:outer membrane protein TolC
MKKLRLNNVFLVTGILMCATVNAQKKNEFSIKQCVDYATKNSVQVKNALLDIQIQQQFNRQVTANAFPQVNASAGITHYIDIPVQSLPNFISPATYQVLVNEGVKNGNGQAITMPNGGDFGTIAAKFGVPWTSSAGFDVSQLLFDGQVFVGLQARNGVEQFARKNAEVTQEQIKANVYKIYYQLAVAKKQVGVLDANIERFEKLLHDTKEIYKNGFAEKLDVDKVTVQLNNIKTEKEKIENMIAAGNSGLKFLMNMPQKEELILTDTLNEAILKEDILNANYNYSDRKEIQLLKIAEKLGGYNVRRYQLSKIPTVAAFASYSKNAQRSSFNFFNKGDWFTTSLVGIKVSIPIFDGNRRNALIQQSKYELQKTKNNIEQLQAAIDYDVEQSRIKMKSALLTLDNQRKNIQLAESVYNTTKKKYEQGLGSNQEIYNQQTELRVAQTDYYNALYDAISAKVDWLKAVGKL